CCLGVTFRRLNFTIYPRYIDNPVFPIEHDGVSRGLQRHNDMRCFNGGSENMRRIGAAAASAAVIILTGAGGAYAADLPTKAPLVPAGPTACTGFMDFFTTACQLAWYGVRFYGTIDVGANYMTKGAPLDPLAGPGLNYFPGKDSHGGR